MIRTRHPSLLIFIAAIFVSSSSFAQGIIEQKRCPNAEKGHHDGNGGGYSDQFTYESWVDDDMDRDGRYFRRCIENKASKSIWTHWKGVLSSSWIPVEHRLFGSTFITRGEVDNSKTDLWWGDNRSQRLVAEARCYKGEDACKGAKTSRVGQFMMVQWSGSIGRAFSLSEELASALDSKKDFAVHSYQEFFVSSDGQSQNANLSKIALSVSSRLNAGELAYSVRVQTSVGLSLKNSEETLFRLSVADSKFSKMVPIDEIRFTNYLLNWASGRRIDVMKEVKFRPSRIFARMISIDVIDSSEVVIASIPMTVLEGE
ncbi:hypothetical protein [Thauera sp. 28]|uniref:hypothetical protein n=1 Tax=Thauera sp. 28 TaxID=303682 RepID=UPI0012F75EB9|nr:hypothetical protein [Thauera sp. 28]